MGPQGGFEVMAEAKYLRGHGACPWVKAFFVPHTAEVLRSSTVIYNAVFTSTQKSFVWKNDPWMFFGTSPVKQLDLFDLFCGFL